VTDIFIYYSEEIPSSRAWVRWKLPEPSDSKLRPWLSWDSEPRITVLARARNNLAVSQSFGLQTKTDCADEYQQQFTRPDRQ
jgi:hypothetical protein